MSTPLPFQLQISGRPVLLIGSGEAADAKAQREAREQEFAAAAVAAEAAAAALIPEEMAATSPSSGSTREASPLKSGAAEAAT